MAAASKVANHKHSMITAVSDNGWKVNSADSVVNVIGVQGGSGASVLSAAPAASSIPHPQRLARVVAAGRSASSAADALLARRASVAVGRQG
jgi:endonuclease V-like protein UPF0215 family